MASNNVGEDWFDDAPVVLDPLLFAGPAGRPTLAGPAAFRRDVRCPGCQYNLRGLRSDENCPECGLSAGLFLFSAGSAPLVLRPSIDRLERLTSTIRLFRIAVILIAVTELAVVTVQSTPLTWFASAVGISWSAQQSDLRSIELSGFGCSPGAVGYVLLYVACRRLVALDAEWYVLPPAGRRPRVAVVTVAAAAVVSLTTTVVVTPSWPWAAAALTILYTVLLWTPWLFGLFAWVAVVVVVLSSRRLARLARRPNAGPHGDAVDGLSLALALTAAVLTFVRAAVYVAGTSPYDLSHLTVGDIASIGSAVAVTVAASAYARHLGRWEIRLRSEVAELRGMVPSS